MRAPRIVLTAVVLLAVTGVAALVAGSRGGERTRVAAIFDSARGMVPGQQVKVAGAPVGSVDDVQLTSDRKARVVMEIDADGDRPFRADARCSILPEGIISESFIDCDPGHSAAPLAKTDGLPTIPVERTAVPVSLQDVIDVFALPTSQRIRVLLDELGIATAARGDDINAILRRANPALTDANRVLSVLNDQREAVGDSVEQTDRVLAELAGRDDDVRGFVRSVADLTHQTAPRSRSITAATRRLPGLLAAARPSLTSIDNAARALTPVLDDVRAAGPQLNTAVDRLGSFSVAGVPSLTSLNRIAASARPALRDVRPAVRRVESVATPLRKGSGELADLLASTRDAGGFEGLWRVVVGFASMTSLKDDVSHILTASLAFASQCVAAEQANTDLDGCSRRYSSRGHGAIPINAPGCGPQPTAWGEARCDLADVISLTAPPARGLTRTPPRERALQRPVAPPTKRVPPIGAPPPAPAPRAVPEADPRSTPTQAVEDLLDFLLR